MREEPMKERRCYKIILLAIVITISNFLSVIIASPILEVQENNQQQLYKQNKNDWYIQTNYHKNPVKNNYHFKNEITKDINNIPFIINSLNGPMNSAWPMFGHDVVHSCRSPFSTESNPGIEIWRVAGDFSGEVESSAIIDNDGIIYFGTMGSDHTLYALFPNGTKKWSYVANGLIWSTPAIAEDGTIYLPSWGSHLFALYPNGQLKWDFGAQAPLASSVSIADDGTIYIGTMAGNLFA